MKTVNGFVVAEELDDLYMNAITILYAKLGCREIAEANYKDLQDEIKEAEERDD